MTLWVGCGRGEGAQWGGTELVQGGRGEGGPQGRREEERGGALWGCREEVHGEVLRECRGAQGRESSGLGVSGGSCRRWAA